jgi:hypothetical protein
MSDPQQTSCQNIVKVSNFNIGSSILHAEILFTCGNSPAPHVLTTPNRRLVICDSCYHNIASTR